MNAQLLNNACFCMTDGCRSEEPETFRQRTGRGPIASLKKRTEHALGQLGEWLVEVDQEDGPLSGDAPDLLAHLGR